MKKVFWYMDDNHSHHRVIVVVADSQDQAEKILEDVLANGLDSEFRFTGPVETLVELDLSTSGAIMLFPPGDDRAFAYQ